MLQDEGVENSARFRKLCHVILGMKYLPLIYIFVRSIVIQIRRNPFTDG